jgi:hypothetical protein
MRHPGGEMSRLGAGIASLMLVLSACPEKRPPPRRAELRKLSGTSVRIVPAPGQLPYCLVFTLSTTGVIRQLTMDRENLSVECQAGEPIGGVSYRFPVNEGTVRIYILFSDRRLNASSIAPQIVEKAKEPSLNVTDLRLPGRANAEVLEFSPAAEGEPKVGRLVGRNRELVDGGSPEGTDAGT